MRIQWQDIRRASDACLTLVGLAFLTCALLWPAPVERLFRCRLAVVVLGVGFVLLHPDIRSGLALGVRNFWRETRWVAEEIRRIIDRDDDDGPLGT
jgi:hypothetical protein